MVRRTESKVSHPASQELARGGSPWRQGPLGALHRFLAREIWVPDLAGAGFARRAAFRALRVLYLTVRNFTLDNCLLRASGLTYITVLSIVPLLAFGFSIAKGFGAYDALRDEVVLPAIDRVLPPSEAGDAAADAGQPAELPPAEAEQERGDLRDGVLFVLETVEKTDFKRLGVFGLVILLYTVIKLIGAVERALNDIWGVPRQRPVVRKVSDYLTLVVITPLFLFTSLGLFTLSQTQAAVGEVREALHLGQAIEFLVSAAPFLIAWAGLTLLYLMLTNTRVRARSASLGGALGAALTIAALVAHNRFQYGVAKFNAIYAGFAAVPIFLFFVYLLWVAFLIGAELAAAHQSEPAYRHLALSRNAGQAERERVGLRTAARVAQAFARARPAPSALELAEKVGAAPSAVEELLERLAAGGLVAASLDDHGERRWRPARPPQGVRVTDVQEVLRATTESDPVVEEGARDPVDARIDAALTGIAEDARRSGHNLSLAELGAAESEEPEAEGARLGLEPAS